MQTHVSESKFSSKPLRIYFFNIFICIFIILMIIGQVHLIVHVWKCLTTPSYQIHNVALMLVYGSTLIIS